jgi:hypothetical protein
MNPAKPAAPSINWCRIARLSAKLGKRFERVYAERHHELAADGMQASRVDLVALVFTIGLEHFERRYGIPTLPLAAREVQS